jgi:type I restriction enzyme S subunit
MTKLSDISLIVDCEHKTAPACDTNEAYGFSVGTPALRGDIIDFSEAKPVSKDVFLNWSKRLVLETGDIILAREAPAGGVGIVPKNIKVCLGQRTVAIRADKSLIHPHYLAFLLKSPEIQLWIKNRSSIGSTVGHLNVSDIKDIPIGILPTLDKQNEILEAIQPLEELITINQEICDELKSASRKIYSYWFEQFEFPNERGLNYKSEGGEFVYNSILGISIPVNWTVGNLVTNDLSNLISPGVEEFKGNKIYLATADVVGDSINSEASVIDFYNRETRADMQPSLYSVWFAKMKATKKHLYFSSGSKKLITRLILSTGFQGIQCKETSFEYILNVVTSEVFEKRKDLLAIGATQEAINLDAMKLIPILEPPKYILNLFHEITKNYYIRILEIEEANLELRNLRDWLVPRLLSNQLQIKSAS